jgi:hypothetical protein
MGTVRISLVRFRWHLRTVLAQKGIFATSALVPLLASRGVMNPPPNGSPPGYPSASVAPTVKQRLLTLATRLRFSSARHKSSTRTLSRHYD